MKRAFVLLILLGLFLAVATPASAQTQPTQGVNSIVRNESGSAGPHCHELRLETGDHFEEIAVFPSHKAHSASGLGNIFEAVDCGGDQVG